MGANQHKSLCTTKETINKIKSQYTEREKIFASDAPDQGLISKLYKKLIHLDIKKRKRKKKEPNQKMGRRTKQTFFQRHTDGQQAHESMVNITNYQRHANQNHNEVSPHTGQNGHHQNNLQIINAGEDVEKREPSKCFGGNVSWCIHYGKQYGGSLKKLKIKLP